MRKSNEQLQRDVLDELRWDPDVKPACVGVSVADGVVTLSGQVPTVAARFAAVRATERVPGVRAIADDLVVHIAGAFEQTDCDVARAVADVLAGDSDVPDSVKARVNGGWLWLEGTADWPFQRFAAEHVIRDHMRHIFGLRGVTNDINVARPAALPLALNPATLGVP